MKIPGGFRLLFALLESGLMISIVMIAMDAGKRWGVDGWFVALIALTVLRWAYELLMSQDEEPWQRIFRRRNYKQGIGE